MTDQPIIHVVEDSQVMRVALTSLLQAAGRLVIGYGSAEEAWEQFDASKPGCWVIDNRLPGMQGVDLLLRIRQEAHSQPVILVSGFADVPMTVEAMQAGAVTVLEKPCDPDQLNEAVENALRLDADRRTAHAAREKTLEKFHTLTKREISVLELLLQGSPNKRIASDLDIGLRTVELRRATIMKKMGVSSLAELVREVLTVWPGPGPEEPPGESSDANHSIAQHV